MILDGLEVESNYDSVIYKKVPTGIRPFNYTRRPKVKIESHK